MFAFCTLLDEDNSGGKLYTSGEKWNKVGYQIAHGLLVSVDNITRITRIIRESRANANNKGIDY